MERKTGRERERERERETESCKLARELAPAAALGGLARRTIRTMHEVVK